MSGLQMLIASADPAKAQRVVRALRETGHYVTLRSDPAGVREALAERPHDMIVLDLGLPGLDRVQLAESLGTGDAEVEPLDLREVERRHIVATLRYTRGNKRRAAQILGIARSTLIQKVRRYGLEGTGRLPG